MTEPKTAALEVAIYEAKDPDRFVGRQAQLHARLGHDFDGYCGSIGLRALSDPNVFADLVLWESMPAAVAAADAIQEMEAFSWMAEELGPIRYFGHFDAAIGPEALSAAAAAPLVEIVLVRPAAPEPFAEAHRLLHDTHLSAADSVVSNLRLARNGDGVAGDVNGWTGQEAMDEMGPRMMSRPELAPVFDEANEMVVFLPFAATMNP